MWNKIWNLLTFSLVTCLGGIESTIFTKIRTAFFVLLESSEAGQCFGRWKSRFARRLFLNQIFSIFKGYKNTSVGRALSKAETLTSWQFENWTINGLDQIVTGTRYSFLVKIVYKLCRSLIQDLRLWQRQKFQRNLQKIWWPDLFFSIFSETCSKIILLKNNE